MAMRRKVHRVARFGACLFSACLFSACLGGQTGQPASATCKTTGADIVASDQDYGGITPRALAQAFVGTHSAPLVWRTGVPAAPDSQQVGAPDEITFVISYSDVAGTTSNDCFPRLNVEVAVDITTRDTGLHESGTLTLAASNGQIEPVSFMVTSDAATVSAMFSGASNALEISGTLETHSGTWPSAWAQFSSADSSSAGAGGSGAP